MRARNLIHDGDDNDGADDGSVVGSRFRGDALLPTYRMGKKIVAGNLCLTPGSQ